MNVSGNVRLRRTNVSTFSHEIIKNTKKINENDLKTPQNFLGAFGAEILNKGGQVIWNTTDMSRNLYKLVQGLYTPVQPVQSVQG